MTIPFSTGCLHNSGPIISVLSSKDEVSLPRDEFEVTVRNTGDEVFEARKMGLAKVVDGEPRHILPTRSHRNDFISVGVGPDETQTWEVYVDNTDPSLWNTDGIEGGLTGLGPGTYRFAPGGIDEETWPDGENMGFEMYHEHSVDVEFVGDYPELEPVEPDSYDVESEDGVVTVGHGEDADGSEVVVRRLAEPDEGAREVIFEQVMRAPGLRNTLAFFDEDVREVRHSPGLPTDAYGVEERFRFDGATYEVEHRDG